MYKIYHKYQQIFVHFMKWGRGEKGENWLSMPVGINVSDLSQGKGT